MASIISVMLGVATMIIVNAVMAGFSHQMRDRIHGILSDIVFEARGSEGFPDSDWHMQRIRRLVGDQIEGMTPTAHTPAMITYYSRATGQSTSRQVMLVGIDERTYDQVGVFGQYLQHPENRKHLSWELRERGYDTHDHQADADSQDRTEMGTAGWEWRRIWAEHEKQWQEIERMRHAGDQATPRDQTTSTVAAPASSTQSQPDAGGATQPALSAAQDPFTKGDDPFNKQKQPAKVFDRGKEQFTGAILGIALASYRDRTGVDKFVLVPGDDVQLTFPNAGLPPTAVSGNFTIVDFYESKMSEYDSTFVFVPLQELQQLRGMYDPKTGIRNVSAIQIKLKPGVDADEVCDKLRGEFPMFSISTWREKQGPLLAAVQMESAVLNLLLFMIIAVAGFGILATFFMIVVEKTRDIGILKSLGASSSGILGIFLSYGLALGIVGSGVGTILGLLFVHYINTIRSGVEWLTGQKVFDPAIYYFYKIPTIIEPVTVAWIVGGTLLIAVMASILPALRAALLHPVEALRYE
jgi:lipoprotein-releasing system permease protein